MEIVWKQAPAICKTKKCLFLLYQVTFIVMHVPIGTDISRHVNIVLGRLKPAYSMKK